MFQKQDILYSQDQNIHSHIKISFPYCHGLHLLICSSTFICDFFRTAPNPFFSLVCWLCLSKELTPAACLRNMISETWILSSPYQTTCIFLPEIKFLRRCITMYMKLKRLKTWTWLEIFIIPIVIHVKISAAVHILHRNSAFINLKLF